jgi:hypothetical protein
MAFRPGSRPGERFGYPWDSWTGDAGQFQLPRSPLRDAVLFETVVEWETDASLSISFHYSCQRLKSILTLMKQQQRYQPSQNTEPNTNACSPHPQTLRDRLMASMGPRYTSVEEYRLNQSDRYEKHWKRWGPYVSERQWVSVACSL